MRKSLITASLVGFVALAGCVSASNVSGIQQAVVAACGYLPTVSTVEDIVNLNSHALKTATQIAQAICAAVTIHGGAGGSEARGPGVGLPVVHGVIIRGKFVR